MSNILTNSRQKVNNITSNTTSSKTGFSSSSVDDVKKCSTIKVVGKIVGGVVGLIGGLITFGASIAWPVFFIVGFVVGCCTNNDSDEPIGFKIMMAPYKMGEATFNLMQFCYSGFTSETEGK